MRREERVTVQGPVKKQQPDGMSHRGVSPPAYRLQRHVTLPIVQANVTSMGGGGGGGDTACDEAMRGGLGGCWHKALVVGSVSLWRRLLATRP